MSYWLIYIYTDRLDTPRAKLFDFGDEIQEWVDEHDNIKVLDCVPQSENEEEL